MSQLGFQISYLHLVALKPTTWCWIRPWSTSE